MSTQNLPQLHDHHNKSWLTTRGSYVTRPELEFDHIRECHEECESAREKLQEIGGNRVGEMHTQDWK